MEVPLGKYRCYLPESWPRMSDMVEGLIDVIVGKGLADKRYNLACAKTMTDLIDGFKPTVVNCDTVVAQISADTADSTSILSIWASQVDNDTEWINESACNSEYQDEISVSSIAFSEISDPTKLVVARSPAVANSSSIAYSPSIASGCSASPGSDHSTLSPVSSESSVPSLVLTVEKERDTKTTTQRVAPHYRSASLIHQHPSKCRIRPIISPDDFGYVPEKERTWVNRDAVNGLFPVGVQDVSSVDPTKQQLLYVYGAPFLTKAEKSVPREPPEMIGFGRFYRMAKTDTVARQIKMYEKEFRVLGPGFADFALNMPSAAFSEEAKKVIWEMVQGPPKKSGVIDGCTYGFENSQTTPVPEDVRDHYKGLAANTKFPRSTLHSAKPWPELGPNSISAALEAPPCQIQGPRRKIEVPCDFDSSDGDSEVFGSNSEFTPSPILPAKSAFQVSGRSKTCTKAPSNCTALVKWNEQEMTMGSSIGKGTQAGQRKAKVGNRKWVPPIVGRNASRGVRTSTKKVESNEPKPKVSAGTNPKLDTIASNGTLMQIPHMAVPIPIKKMEPEFSIIRVLMSIEMSIEAARRSSQSKNSGADTRNGFDAFGMRHISDK